jgi:tRNA nucleotidyltransferase (CCA-adding enzyme)
MRVPPPAEAIRALPPAAAGLVEAVLEVADARGVGVYLVGGPVRDLLLERPFDDVDLIVEGAAAAELAEAAGGPEARLRSHQRFGTVSLQAGEARVDLATVRRETYAHDGALPSVESGTLEEDLRRRDFTVNALALPLSKPACARHSGIVDLEGGCRDLEERRLRVLHRRSFHDDPTRALRAGRLAPRLRFSLSRGSRSALRDALRDGAFGRVSGDRLRREMVKLFDDPAHGLDPARALRLLNDWHVLGALEPGLALAPEATAPLRRLGRALEDPPWRRGRCRAWVAGLAVWLVPLAPALRRRALRRFAVRGDTAKRIDEFSRARDAWLRALSRARGRGPADAALAGIAEEELLALLVWAPPPARRRIVRWAREDRQRRPPLGGDDLRAIGFSGPAIGRALAHIRIAYLDGAVKTRDEAIALAGELVRPKKTGGARKARRGVRR